MRSYLSSFATLLCATTMLGGCSMAPDFKLPDIELPEFFKEEQVPAADIKPLQEDNTAQGNWKPAKPLEKEDRGQWWKIFGDEQLDALEKQALEANQSLQAAAARVQQARSLAGTYRPSILPDLSIGGNAVRSKPASASLAAFGGAPGVQLKPYTMYSAQGVASYEADLFGRVRDNYKAFQLDADAQEGAYRSTLLALQADVAQHYFSLRALDTERQLLRETIKIREEAARIMGKRFDVGDVGEQDNTRTQSELAAVRADLIALDRQRAATEHALAVLLGKLPSQFSFNEGRLEDAPPRIPGGLPSSLLERRPDIASATANMAAANARIGVARSAFFPQIMLTASGGFESIQLSDLFLWSSRTWALGQLAGSAITMPIFENGRNMAQLDVAHAAYDEAVANYRQQVLVAFKDVEDNLSDQKLLLDQSQQLDKAAGAAKRTWELTQKRYDQGDVDYFEVVNAQRDALNAQRAAVQARGQRFITTVGLIQALGGAWDEGAKPAEPPALPAESEKK